MKKRQFIAILVLLSIVGCSISMNLVKNSPDTEIRTSQDRAYDDDIKADVDILARTQKKKDTITKKQ